MLTDSRIAERIGFSMALDPDSISAYHDAAKYTYPLEKKGRRIRRAFMRGWNNGYITLHKVKQGITTGEIVFVRYQGEYEEILSGKKILDAGLLVPDVA